MEYKDREYALITGASRGLGKAIAHELAARNIPLLLISLGNEGLPQVCHEIREQYQVKTDYLEVNLTNDNAPKQIFHWIGNRGVRILVNNAGIGGSMTFESAGTEYLERIIQVNIRTLSLLTWHLTPKLKACSNSFILNVASMASFSPIAYKTIYPASKAFVYNFSLCLKEELRNTSISVSVLHPGPMPTNSDVTSRIQMQGRIARYGVLSAEKVAAYAVKGLFAKRAVIIPGMYNKMNWLMLKVIPCMIKIPFVSSIIKKEISYLGAVA